MLICQAKKAGDYISRMNEQDQTDSENQIDIASPEQLPKKASGTGLFKLIWILILRPKAAFEIMSAKERSKLALICYLLYFIAKMPFLINGQIADGTFAQYPLDEKIILMALAFSMIFIVNGAVWIFFGLFLHLITSMVLKADRTGKDAVALVFMALAPKLLMFAEWPFIFYKFGEYESHLTFLFFNIGLSILSVRIFYSGLRNLFGLSLKQIMMMIFIFLGILFLFGVMASVML